MKPFSSRLLAASSLILPALVVAQTFVLVINTKDGQKIEIETQDIDKMEVVERVPVVTPLASPVVTFKTNTSGGLLAVWDEVEGAYYYAYSIDGADQIATYNTFVNLQNEKPGNHTLSVIAIPADESFDISAPCVVNFHIDLKIGITQTSLDRTSATFSFSPNVNGVAYLAGVLPASVNTDEARIAQVRDLAANDRSIRHVGSDASTFSNLTAGQDYQVVAFEEVDPRVVYTFRFTTTADSYKPGSTGYSFPPNVNLDGGFVDVDKVGDLSKYGYSGTDDELCWACSTTGMIQWWLDDYKRTTGSDYPMNRELPATSKCYSTPVMDVVAQAFYHDAGNPVWVMQWFFTGMPNSVGTYTLNSHSAFNLDYAYVDGNFAGMSKDLYSKIFPYAKEQNSYFLYSGLTEKEVSVKASADIIGWLQEGPLYISINGGNHALTCWGVKYTVDVNGNPIINKLYFAENDMVGGNVKNGLNSTSITWKAGDGPHMISTQGQNVEITGFFPMRGYSKIQ